VSGSRSPNISLLTSRVSTDELGNEWADRALCGCINGLAGAWVRLMSSVRRIFGESAFSAARASSVGRRGKRRLFGGGRERRLAGAAPTHRGGAAHHRFLSLSAGHERAQNGGGDVSGEHRLRHAPQPEKESGGGKLSWKSERSFSHFVSRPVQPRIAAAAARISSSSSSAGTLSCGACAADATRRAQPASLRDRGDGTLSRTVRSGRDEHARANCTTANHRGTKTSPKTQRVSKFILKI